MIQNTVGISIIQNNLWKIWQKTVNFAKVLYKSTRFVNFWNCRFLYKLHNSCLKFKTKFHGWFFVIFTIKKFTQTICSQLSLSWELLSVWGVFSRGWVFSVDALTSETTLVLVEIKFNLLLSMHTKFLCLFMAAIIADPLINTQN